MAKSSGKSSHRGRVENLLPGGVIGHKGGGGRPTDEFKKKMLALSNSPAAWKFRKDVIEGNPIEERMILNPITGKEMKTLVTPSIENRRRMLADIDDRAHGKAEQSVSIPQLGRFIIQRAGGTIEA